MRLVGAVKNAKSDGGTQATVPHHTLLPNLLRDPLLPLATTSCLFALSPPPSALCLLPLASSFLLPLAITARLVCVTGAPVVVHVVGVPAEALTCPSPPQVARLRFCPRPPLSASCLLPLALPFLLPELDHHALSVCVTGALVVVHVVGVPADAAAAVIQRVNASLSQPQQDAAMGGSSSSGSSAASLPPLVAFGLMMHEGKLSVLHTGIRKAATFQAPIANKEELLFVTGERTLGRGFQHPRGFSQLYTTSPFTSTRPSSPLAPPPKLPGPGPSAPPVPAPCHCRLKLAPPLTPACPGPAVAYHPSPGVRTFAARPVFSADAPGDKHKMERYLHAGRHMVASIYAPISYGPLPLLAFKLPEGQGQGLGLGRYAGAALAASGSVRACDPDRVILKKITLTGGLGQHGRRGRGHRGRRGGTCWHRTVWLAGAAGSVTGRSVVRPVSLDGVPRLWEG